MLEIRAFISDLDDTLLNEQHQITDRTLKTLWRLNAQGVKVVLASGRSAASMRPMVRKVGSPYPYIAYNGAQIVDGKTDAVLSASEVSLPLSRAMLSWFESRGIYAQYYEGDEWFYETPCQISEDYGKSSKVPGTQAAGKLSQSIRRPTPKILAVDAPERVAELLPIAQHEFGDSLSITTSKPYFIEVTSPDATKGSAVRKLATMLGLAPETTICAGDSLNDITMLHWSRLPVSVSNAREEVRALAWRIAGDGHKDGIAELLDELIPPEE